jgi:hypothetical protein
MCKIVAARMSYPKCKMKKKTSRKKKNAKIIVDRIINRTVHIVKNLHLPHVLSHNLYLPLKVQVPVQT